MFIINENDFNKASEEQKRNLLIGYFILGLFALFIISMIFFFILILIPTPPEMKGQETILMFKIILYFSITLVAIQLVMWLINKIRLYLKSVDCKMR